jgi:hypothetical protein
VKEGSNHESVKSSLKIDKPGGDMNEDMDAGAELRNLVFRTKPGGRGEKNDIEFE